MSVLVTTKIRRGLRRDFRNWILVGQRAWWLYIVGDHVKGRSFIGVSMDDDLKRIRLHVRIGDEWTYYNDVKRSTLEVSLNGNELTITCDDKKKGEVSLCISDSIDKTQEYV